MSNAAKLKKKAAEFEQKKQFDKALQLYVQILDESAGDDDAEGDVALYNRVGDLLMRQGSVGDAMTYYEKAVDLYAESGFFNNAIALCNKILRQSPGRNSIYYKLGKISAKKGFISDAKQNFLEYASRMQTGGQLDEAFRALKEFADLCPDQDDIRLMLADQLSKKDRKGEALEQLQLLYEKFEVEGRGADMRATVDRMKAIDPAAEPKTGGGQRSQKSTDLVFLDLSDGEPVKPHKGAKVVPPPAPRGSAGPKARQSGGGGGGGGGGPSRTSGPARAPADPGPISRISAPVPEPPSTADDYPTLDPMPSLASGPDDPLVSDSPIAAAPDHVQGFMGADTVSPDDLPAPVTLPGFEPSALDAELNLAFGDGLPGLPGVDPPLSGEQFASLRLATPLDSPLISPHPHDLALPGQLPELGGSSASAVSFTGEMELIIPEDDAEFASNASASAPAAADRHRGAARPSESGESAAGGREAAAALPSVDRSSDMDLPLLDVDLPTLDAEPSADEREQVHGDPLGLVSGAELLDVSDLGAELRPAADGADEYLPPPVDGTDEQSLDAREATAERAPRATEAVGSDDGIELPAWMDGAGAKPAAPTDSAAAPEAPVQRPRRVSTPVPGAADAASGAPSAAGEGSRRPSQSPLARSMEALRTRSEASPTDWSLRRQLAEALFEEGDRDAGLRELEAAMIGLERAQDLDGARSVADEIIRLNPNSVRHHQKRVEYAFRTNDRSRLPEAYLELADALFRSGQADKARAVYHRVLELAPQDPRAQAALSTFGDLPGEPPPSAPARKSRGSGSAARRKSGGAPARRRGDPPPVEVSATADSASGFVNLGDWLRDDEAPKSTRLVVDDEEPTGDEEADFADMLRRFKRGIAENVSDEDHESHYDLGVAYKEMGLVDEAISEFQKALRAPSHRVRTFEALGQCFIEKQQFQVATTILGRALNEPGVTDDLLVGVLYLLGYACEALMRWEAAIGYYQRVFGVDIQFRDTAQRLTMLERAPR